MKVEAKRPLLIGQIAKLAGVKSDTVRFYERTGLLPPPTRTASGYRAYDKSDGFVREVLRGESLLRPFGPAAIVSAHSSR